MLNVQFSELDGLFKRALQPAFIARNLQLLTFRTRLKEMSAFALGRSCEPMVGVSRNEQVVGSDGALFPRGL